MIDWNDIFGYAAQYESDILEDWKSYPPCQKGQLVEVYPPSDILFAIGRVMGCRVDDDNLRFLVDVEIAQAGDVNLLTFDANIFRFARHVGFHLGGV